MAHPSQREFVERVRDKFPEFFDLCRVLEVGSRNVNGTVRDLFSDCHYTGIDCHGGKMVDIVTVAHEFRPGEESIYDTVISCEAFEHDPHLRQTIDMIHRVLRPGGLFVATWASDQREEHGTTRTGDDAWGPDPDYYHGVSASEFYGILGDRFKHHWFEDGRNGTDVYFWGFR